jgi:hypothetical protein
MFSFPHLNKLSGIIYKTDKNLPLNLLMVHPENPAIDYFTNNQRGQADYFTKFKTSNLEYHYVLKILIN